MATVGINRLRLRGPPELATRSAFLIEDACRTELPDSERLVLIRRLALGPAATAAEPRARAAEMRRAYELATRDSRHGGDDGGGSANCVWFASRAEARRLLLRLLLAGQRPSGWYWPLAVPGWRGQSLTEWLAESAAGAVSGTAEADLVELVVMAVEAGAADAVVEALARAAGAPATLVVPLLWASPGATRATPRGTRERTASIADLPGTLAQLRARIPSGLAERIETVARRVGAGSKAAQALIERLLVRASPPLALSPVLLRELTSLYAEILDSPERAWIETPATGAQASAEPMDREAVAAESRAPTATDQAEPVGESCREAAEAPTEPEGPVRAEAGEVEVPSPLPDMLDEVHSRAAGLWLVVPSLVHMGLREWLAERPELLALDPGRVLLRTIAAHHRVDADDPALRPLVADDGDFELPEWAQLWRVGLDRWLHRRTRVKLSRLVWRPGWLRSGDERLTVRFPPAAADIRLRRRALDVDPGWVDWLGLSVRYAYAEREIP